ncbi:MAG: hypothetical protein JSS02_14580 [Planctomycetes bacterium]|nr:hypothetical protein [Planctomycetota bacterium]
MQRLFGGWPATVGLWLVIGATGCWKHDRAADTASATATAARPLAIVVSCDTAGWIVPCGCSSKQAGGLPRRATYARLAGAASDLLVADAGGAPGGTSPYDRLKFEYIARGELAMDIAAHNVGAAEARLGAAELRRLSETWHVPFVSTNVRDTRGERIAAAHQLVERQGTRVAILGVLSPGYRVAGLEIANPAEAILSEVASLRGQFDVLLVLAYLPEAELESLATQIPEADLIAGGPTGQSRAPQQAGPTLWGSATNKGKFLLHFERPAKKAAWSGRIVELGTDYADQERQLENLQSFREELGRVDFTADQTSFAPALPAQTPADFRVVGSEACEACHADDCQSWRASRHGRAWLTLLEKESQVDPYCQHCHTTGYGLPGGFTSLAASGDRVQVGCENCHGPAQAHARQPSLKTLYDARDRCVVCHDHENSPKFDYASYWELIVHGKKP